ncbi:MAG: ribonuclease HII [Bacteroidales bacterium]
MLKSYYTKDLIEAGCDEAGRGCLAGPVFAAAVILPSAPRISGLNDSKKLSAIRREELRLGIEKHALSFAVGSVGSEEIDEINILNASFLAMHRALDMLATCPGQILVDGNRFRPYRDVGHICIIRGDGKYLSVAAASILAKTYRDDYMREIDKQYPEYGWRKNMGYPTLQHREAIKNYGLSDHHRRSFRLKNEQLSIEF